MILFPEIKKILPIVCWFVFVACQYYPADVRLALKNAGQNRTELEKVLTHYKQDPLKYQAACFLIGNMPYHRTDKEIEFDESYFSHFIRVDSLYSCLFESLSIEEADLFIPTDLNELCQQWGNEFKNIPEPRYTKGGFDLATIHSSFLIDNIDEAFDVWEQSPFLKSMDFETFKEFILPYRTTTESLTFKRSTLRKLMEKHLFIDGCDSIHIPIERYRVVVDKFRWLNRYINFDQESGLYVAFLPKQLLNCYPLTTWTTNFFRSCGIPVVFEYTPQWRDRARKHYWCASPDKKGVVKPYTVHDNNLMQDWDKSIKKASKVYRLNFGAQKEAPFFLCTKEEFIPNELSSPLISDETYRYAQTVTLRIPFPEKTNNKLVYLAQFAREQFNPVAWGIIDKKRNEAVFKQVPINTFFFPIYYNDQNAPVSFSTPFSIHSENVIESVPVPMTTSSYSSPVDITIKGASLVYSDQTKQPVNELSLFTTEEVDKTEKVDLHLTRKYPDKTHFISLRNKQVGGYFYGYNENPSSCDTLHILTSPPHGYYQELTLSHTGRYKYYGFRMPNLWDTENAHIGEMAFLGPYDPDQDCQVPVPLPVFQLSDTLQNESSKVWEICGVPSDSSARAFDKNVLTTVLSNIIEVEYPSPAFITHVRFIPRNGNNIVVPGNLYELYYFDKGWIFLNRKVAEYNFLEFTNVPANTLYWLKNITEGDEELPFFYHEGKQHYLNHDFPSIK